jgi:hypothetical protein
MYFAKRSGVVHRLSSLHPQVGPPDGSFVLLTKDGDVTVAAKQGAANPKILPYIQQTLGFDKVYKGKTGDYEWKVNKLDHIKALALLFNGNMVMPTRAERFKNFLAAYNAKKHSSAILLIGSTILPTLHDQWLHGFTCAEGCFHASLQKNSFMIDYSISQNGNCGATFLSLNI